MNNKQLLRSLAQSSSDKIRRQEAARKEVSEIKQSVLRHEQQTAAERELPELEGLITKQHLRHARRVMSDGKHRGATIDRLPIYQGNGQYHQKDHRDPKSTEFEAPLAALIVRYGAERVVEHFSLGQHMKYQLRLTVNGATEIWNIGSGKREYPAETAVSRLMFMINASLEKVKLDEL